MLSYESINKGNFNLVYIKNPWKILNGIYQTKKTTFAKNKRDEGKAIVLTVK